MNHEDIIRMAREAGAVFSLDGKVHSFEFEGSLERFAELVAAAEREACAQDLNRRSTALRTALEQPEQPEQPEQEPVAWMLKSGHGTEFKEKLTDELKALTWKGKPMWTPLYDAPPQRKPLSDEEYQGSDEAKAVHMMDLYEALGVKWGDDPFPVIAKLRGTQLEQEPVATVTSETGADISMSWWHEPALRVGTKLYTAPPQRKPLSDDEIQAIWKKTFESGSSPNTFARAIEHAHNIKE